MRVNGADRDSVLTEAPPNDNGVPKADEIRRNNEQDTNEL
jgi:hypothetical protein